MFMWRSSSVQHTGWGRRAGGHACCGKAAANVAAFLAYLSFFGFDPIPHARLRVIFIHSSPVIFHLESSQYTMSLVNVNVYRLLIGTLQSKSAPDWFSITYVNLTVLMPIKCVFQFKVALIAAVFTKFGCGGSGQRAD